MKVLWHPRSRQFQITEASSAKSIEALGTVPSALKRWDNITGSWWIPEIAWPILDSWPWKPERRSDLFDRYHIGRAPLTGKPPRIYATKTKVKPYQVPAIEGLISSDAYLLGDDMGLGKTLCLLLAWQHLKLQGLSSCLIVVAPANVVKHWHEQFALHLGYVPTKDEFQVISYAKTYRDKHSALIRLLLQTERCVLVLDECHRLASEGSQQYREIWRMAREAKRVWGATGTPVRNRLESFCGVYKAITGAEVTREQFLSRYAKRDGYGRITGYREKRFPELEAVFHTFGIRRLKAELRAHGIDLPDKALVPVRVTLGAQQAKLYNEAREQANKLLAATKGKPLTGYRKNTVLHTMGRMVQAAAYPPLLGDVGFSDADLQGLAKLQALDELLDEAGDQKVIVWSRHPMILEAIAKRYPERKPAVMHGGRERSLNEKAKKRFIESEECTLACLSLEAFAEGVDGLQHAAGIAVYHDVYWTFDKLIQSLDRIHRLGQTRAVTCYFLIAEGTLDEYVYGKLSEKSSHQGAITGSSETLVLEGFTSSDLRTYLGTPLRG